MRRWAVLLFIILSLIIYAQSGSIQLQPEHQVYVISMGLEHTPEGNVKLSVLCPKIAGESSSEYQTFEGEGDSVCQALEDLKLSVPRHLVYVQLKSLLLSEEFASSDAMEDLVYYFLLGGEFYSDAWVMISPQAPSSFISDYGPVIGTRLSASILATMENYTQLNVIPSVYLADLIDGWNTIYGDVVAVSCHPKKVKDVVSLIPDGAALFSEKRLALQLDAEETQIMNWLRGSYGDVTLEDGDSVLNLIPEFPAKVSFDWEQNRIVISGHFIQRTQAGSIPTPDLERLLERNVTRLIARCQAANTEPFLFSEQAGRSFVDVEAYRANDFRSFYRSADVLVDLTVRDELT